MFERILNLIKGGINRWIYGMEVKNPETAYDNSIDQLSNSYKLLKEKAAAVVRRAQDLQDSTTETQTQLNKVTNLLEQAAKLPTERVDMVAAADMVNTREQLQEKLTGLLEDLHTAQADQQEITEALMEVQSSKKKLMAEKDMNIGRYRSAEARMAIMEQNDGTSITAINKALEGVRTNIKNTIAEANLTKQLQSNTLENRVKNFTKLTEGASAQQKFLAMREQAQLHAATTSAVISVDEAAPKQLAETAK